MAHLLASSIVFLSLLGPIVYCLAMIAVWACVDRRSVRYGLLTVMICGPVILSVSVWKQLRNADELEQVFVDNCKQYARSEIIESVQDVPGILINHDPYTSRDSITKTGNAIFHPAEARLLFLQGVMRYDYIETLLPAEKFEHTKVVSLSTKTIRTNTRLSKYGVEWGSVDMSPIPHISGARLLLKDMDGDKVLASHVGFVFDHPSITLLRGTRTPLLIRPAIKKVCPRPHELVSFIKTVIKPPVSEL